MLSRTAESFFWMGRYLERVEYTARYTNVHYHLLLENTNSIEQTQPWKEYLEGNGEFQLYQEIYGSLRTQSVLEFLTLQPQNPNSLFNLIQKGRENARGIQDQLSSEVWCHINDFYLGLTDTHNDALWPSPHRLLTHIQHMCYTADGVLGSTMLHDEGWNFYRLGKNIERAGRTARLLNETVLSKADPEPEAISDYHQCLAILKSASAYEAYRKFYRSQLVPRKIVQFLLFHNKFPRSVRFAASLIRQMLSRLSSGLHNPQVREAERLAGQFAADLEFGNLEEIYRLGLPVFLTQVVSQIDQITNHIAQTFFGSEGYCDQPVPVAEYFHRPPIHVSQPRNEPIKATLAVQHSFVYRYDSPVSQVKTVMRLAPPQHYGKQRRLDIRWQMDPPSDYRHFTDAFGNLVWQLDHAHIEDEIHCTIEMRVETQALYLIDGTLALQGVQPQESDCTVEAAEFTQLTRLVDRSEGLLHMTRQSQERGMTPFELAESFLHQVHTHMRYESGRTHVGTTAAEAFAQGAGVCQDYAHVMLALCRLAGLSARYVSGYLPGEGQMHAWIEVLLSTDSQGTLLWVPYDPTHQRRCDERYLTVAIGRDYEDIAPTSGYYSGDATNSLTTSVSVTMENHGGASRWPVESRLVQTTAASHELVSQQQ